MYFKTCVQTKNCPQNIFTNFYLFNQGPSEFFVVQRFLLLLEPISTFGEHQFFVFFLSESTASRLIALQTSAASKARTQKTEVVLTYFRVVRAPNYFNK